MVMISIAHTHAHTHARAHTLTHTHTNRMDTFVVVISIAGLIDESIPAVNVLRLVRVFKMVRRRREIFKCALEGVRYNTACVLVCEGCVCARVGVCASVCI